MITCPSCGQQNADDDEFCSQCAHVLTPPPPEVTTAPEQAAQPEAPARPDSPESPQVAAAPPSPLPPGEGSTSETVQPSVPAEPTTPIELGRGPEPAPSRLPAFLFLVAVLAGAVGLWVWSSNSEDPCEGKFSSDRFAYCVAVPSGWHAGPAKIGAVTLDQFAPATAPTKVLVAAFDLPTNVGLDSFVAEVRGRDKQAGLEPGPARRTTLDGAAASVWDTTISDPNTPSFKVREIVVVTGGMGWRITLNDSAIAFGGHLSAFQRMMASWHFR